MSRSGVTTLDILEDWPCIFPLLPPIGDGIGVAELRIDAPVNPRQISARTLFSDDIVGTDSPAGHGMHHNRCLSPGDVIEGAGVGPGYIRNICIAETE
jgi:hypothetical protein